MRPIFEYMNYREFLGDFYADKKKKAAFYSFRIFSQKAGFKSPNFLKLVIDGERNLSKESVFKFAKALKLSKKEAEYFEDLVFFNQSKTLEEKNVYLKRMMKFRKKSDPQKIEESEYRYYSSWYHPVLRELATAMDFKNDYRKLGQMVIPQISAIEAERSVKLLKELNFIAQDSDGAYKQTSLLLTTGPQVRSIAVANYHKEMMRLASESIERFRSDQRDITSLTMSLSEENRTIIIDKLEQLRKELLEMVESEKGPEKVYQLNFQMFPLSREFDWNEGGE